MPNLNPYLRFNGNCREAMDFYYQCLGGKLQIDTVGDSPMAAQMPPESHKNVIHAVLEADGLRLMAADGMQSGPGVTGTIVSLCISGGNKDIQAIKDLFAKFAAGGKVVMPIEEHFFGLYGELTDKFGVNWMFQADGAAAEHHS